MTSRVLIVDDHEVARTGIADIVETLGFTVAASVSNGSDAIEHLTDNTIDLVLLDVQLRPDDGKPDNGLTTLDLIRDRSPDLPVVIFSQFRNPTYIARASALKANAYVLKSFSGEALRNRLRQAANGEPPSADSLIGRARRFMLQEIDAASLPREFPVTSREAQVLRHLGLGLSNKDIARSLEISVETVKEHVQNVIRKIGARDRTDAAVRAHRAGLVEFPEY